MPPAEKIPCSLISRFSLAKADAAAAIRNAVAKMIRFFMVFFSWVKQEMNSGLAVTLVQWPQSGPDIRLILKFLQDSTYSLFLKNPAQTAFSAKPGDTEVTR